MPAITRMKGFGLRVVRGETSGYAHATEINEGSLRRAVETARLAVRDGGGTMAPPPIKTNRKLYTDSDPVRESEFSAKIALLKEIEFLRTGYG